MKKIVGIIAALAMVAGVAFADDPALGPSVLEFKGDAALDFVVDLDSEEFGMQNVQNTNLKLQFLADTTKATEGSDLWGELEIKVVKTEVNQTKGSTNVAAPAWINAPTIEKAIIHFVDDDFYASMDIKGPDLGLGGGKFVIATRSDSDTYANPAVNVNSVGAGKPGGAQGFKFNFGLKDLFDANISFADDGLDVKDTKDFAFKADASLKAVENLDLYGAVGYSTVEEKVAVAAKASYKVEIDDTMYLRPSVGFTLKDDAKALAAAVFFGWGAENKDANFASFSAPTFDYFTINETTGPVPSATNIPNKVSNGASVYLSSDLDEGHSMLVGVYDDTLLGGVISGLACGADFYIPSLKDAGDAWELNAALKYGNTFDIWQIDANFGIKAINWMDETKAGFLYGFGVSTDNSLIQNTKLYAKYAGEHAEDIGAANSKGKITVGAQIHF